MKFNRILALAAITLAAAAPAGAAVVSFSQGDLLMGFHASGGTGAGQTYVVDIGSAATYRDATGTLTIDLGNIGADLSSVYGANWYTRTDLQWGVAGSPSNVDTVNGDPSRTLYASRADSSVGWQITSATNRSAASTRMQGLATAFASYESTANSSHAVIQDDTAPNGWRSYMSGSGTSTTDFSSFSDIEGTPAQTLSLFRLTDSNPGSLEGYFTLSSSGQLTFTAVPEASSALIAGLGSLLLVVRRRRNA